MRTKLRLLAVMLIAGGTMFARTRVSIGIGVGSYAPSYYAPPSYQQYQPPRYENMYRDDDRDRDRDDDRDRDRDHDRDRYRDRDRARNWDRDGDRDDHYAFRR